MKVTEVWQLGPLPAPTSAFGKGEATGGLNLQELKPTAGKAVFWLGKKYRWRLLESEDGKLILPSGKPGRLAYLAAYLENPRWQKLSFALESRGKAKLMLDGSRLAEANDGKVSGIKSCHRGHWPIVLKLTAPAKGAWEVKLAVTPKGVKVPEAPTFQLKHAHIPARFRQIWQRKSVRNLASFANRLAFTNGVELQVWDDRYSNLFFRAQIGRASHLYFLNLNRLAFLADGNLRVIDLEKNKQDTLCKGLKNVKGLQWAPDHKRIFWLEVPARPKAKPVQHKTNLRRFMQDWNPGCRIWTADLQSGLRRPITATGDFHIPDFVLGPKGDRLVLVKKLPLPVRPWFTTEFWEMKTADLAARKVATMQTGFESWPGDLRFSPDGKKVLFVAPPAEIWAPADPKAPTGPVVGKEAGQKESPPAEVVESHGEHNYHNADLYILNLKAGKIDRLTGSFDPGVASRVGAAPWWSQDGKMIHFLAMTGRRNTFYSVDLAGSVPQFKGWECGPRVITKYAVSSGDEQVAFLSGSFTRLPFVCRLSREDTEPKEIFDPNVELLKNWKLAQPVDFSFINKAGVRIDGWVYQPRKKQTGKIPLVVYYYAGATATREVCYWTHQFLVANGYALYVLNPRGAGEYGRQFADSHVNDWGARASADVIEGVGRLLQAKPELDGKKIGCWGGSYGGFTTMDLLTKTKLFAAAVSLYGISNIASYWGAGTWGWTYGDMAIARSFPWNRPDIFVNRSPLFNADKIVTPLLLLHGLADVNVPAVESDQMFTALKVLGRTVEYVTFAGEDHGISGSRESRSSHRIMLLEWFDKFLRDQPEAWQARWNAK